MARPTRLIAALSLASALLTGFAPAGVRAAELVMFARAGCSWCETFDREIAPIYSKTVEGARAPLRRVDLAEPLPSDLANITVERLTPVFVLVDKGQEIGRIRGYPGEAFFWGMLGELIGKLEPASTGVEPVPPS
jgi:thioredoxin-related protein